jgi:hypothetical protein
MSAFAARARIVEWILIAVALAMFAVSIALLVWGWDDTVLRGRVFVRTLKLLVPACVLLVLPYIRRALFTFVGDGAALQGDAGAAKALWGFIVAACAIGIAVIGYDLGKVLTY